MAGGAGAGGAGARRKLVLNGLTAEVREPGPAGAAGARRPSSEFYHELELYRQLLALPPATSPANSPPTSPLSGCSPAHAPPAPAAPAPAPEPAALATTTPVTPAPAARAHVRPATYLGSFPATWDVCVDGDEGAGESSVSPGAPTPRVALSERLHHIKECCSDDACAGSAARVLLVVALSGVRVCDPQDQSVRMWHALRRISYATCEPPRRLFAFVARPPRARPAPHHPPPADSADTASAGARAAHYCHAFHTDTPQQAEELNRLVGDAFRMAFASQLHPSAPLWSKELGARGGGGGGSECGGMGVRAPASLPGLAPGYPHTFVASQCESMAGLAGWCSSVSPSSSEESASPPAGCAYRRLGERAPLVRRLARGLGAAGAGAGGAAALLHPSDDDSTPLVADTPTTPTDVSVCLNGGYMNEAAEAAARARDTRASNREPALPAPVPASPAPPVPALPAPGTPRRHVSEPDADIDFKKCNNFLNNCSAASGSCGDACADGACSRTGSSSSGGSYGGGGAHNNNPRVEPELTHAPWFQQGIPREIALEVLGGMPVGAFLVRGSTTQPACLALSVRVPQEFAAHGIAHYLILRTNKGYKIKGFTKEFSSLSALVTHHSVMPELLPVPLRLARAPPAGFPWEARGPHRRDHADIDAIAPRHTPRDLVSTHLHHSTPPSQHASPRRAHTHTHSHHSTPHHVANFLTQLDV